MIDILPALFLTESSVKYFQREKLKITNHPNSQETVSA